MAEQQGWNSGFCIRFTWLARLSHSKSRICTPSVLEGIPFGWTWVVFLVLAFKSQVERHQEQLPDHVRNWEQSFTATRGGACAALLGGEGGVSNSQSSDVLLRDTGGSVATEGLPGLSPPA